jgi:hypothetical protein
MAKINKEELEWRAQDDARILAQYQEILSDKSRLSRAKKAASKEVKNLNNRLKIMQKVSNTKKGK